MAIHAPITGAPLGATMFHPTRAPRVRRLLSALSPDEIGEAIEALIARLDALDGDTDVEITGTEDDFVQHPTDGPGCPVSDPDSCSAHDDNLYRLFCDGAPGDPDDAEDENDREQVNEDGVGDLSPLKPRYGVDQSLGPVNMREGYRAWQESFQ